MRRCSGSPEQAGDYDALLERAYFHARLADQFDAVVHLDETQAVEPLELTSEWEAAVSIAGTR